MSANNANYAEKVKTGWGLAISLRSSRDYNNSASRMYYSVFQAVLYYAVAKTQFDPVAKRADIHRCMSDLVKENFKEQKEYGRIYGQLRKLRNQADYDPVNVSPSDLDQEFVHKIECIKDFFLKEVKR